MKRKNRKYNKLWKIFNENNEFPSPEQIEVWDDEILKIFKSKEQAKCLICNILILMAANEIRKIADLAARIEYDPTFVSKILNGTLINQSNWECFYSIAHELKTDLDTLLKINLVDNIKNIIDTN